MKLNEGSVDNKILVGGSTAHPARQHSAEDRHANTPRVTSVCVMTKARQCEHWTGDVSLIEMCPSALLALS